MTNIQYTCIGVQLSDQAWHRIVYKIERCINNIYGDIEDGKITPKPTY